MPTGVNAQQQQDKQAYDKQWHDTWQQGLEPGQVCLCMLNAKQHVNACSS